MGIGALGYAVERNDYLDYTHPVGDISMQWISKTPGRVAPVYNIVRIFDLTTWILILITLLMVSTLLLVASSFGLEYGVGARDRVLLFMYPFGSLNAEPLPSWFEKKARKPKHVKHITFFFSKGFSGNFVLILWTVMGSFITMAFLCNIRAMLMKPVFERTIDVTQDIFESGNNAGGCSLH